jgi:hypothetical protein
MTEPIAGPRVLSDVLSYDDVHAVMRRRAEELEVSREVLDTLSGMANGYASKVLCDLTMSRSFSPRLA